VGGTRDYLAWNRLRWAALHDLMDRQQIRAGAIDGGFEFNGWYLYDPEYKPVAGKSSWWVQNDRYCIGFGGMPGYTVVQEYRYHHWLPPYAAAVVMLKKNEATNDVNVESNPANRLAK